MIRVTTIDRHGSPQTLRVEGTLRRADVDELDRACRLVAGDGRPVVLDLSGVLFMDAAGAECLRRMRSGGVTLTGCNGLVEELLRQPPP